MAQLIVTAGQALASTAAQAAAQAAASYAASQAVTAGQNALFGPETSEREGPRLGALRLMGAEEGAPIPRVYGRARLSGQLLWTSGFRETTRVTETRSGGKGITRSRAAETTEYLYSADLAIGLCEGVIDRVGRVWADGEPLALRDYTVRLHRGAEDQLPDPLLEAALGEDAPAYRGLAYLVLEDFPLETFGNRIPQLSFEVERSLRSDDPEALENACRAVTLIPASGEAVYETEAVFVEAEEGVTRPLNVFSNTGATDAVASLDHLQAALPNTGAVEVIVSWFGTDLRAGACAVRPGVEDRDKRLLPEPWSVAGEDRTSAHLVSQRGGAPAYGGTPSDRGVRQIIRDLHARGLEAVFYPFVLMDVPPGNGLADPYGAAEQGAYPWRGRITVPPGVDGTAAARAQVDTFFDGYAVMIRHYARLCAEEGGVHAFLVGSELRGLTQIRDEAGRYPGAERLVALAREVKALLPDALVSYAADWSEYAHHQPGPDSADHGSLYYPLDAFWADDAVGFVGIDNYMPLADWRAGRHLDAEAGARSQYDLDYLRANIRGGEGYDWYYASEADRAAQRRTPITDTAHGEDWAYRNKDLWSWWSNLHTERPGGAKGETTAWVPRSKPIWFTELGCSATDKGANQPNVFVDPKSSENAYPYWSNGERDDLAQRRFLEAHLSYWTEPENNPVSDVYGGPMVEPSRVFLYTWDARPFPDFPLRSEVWSDAENWTYGHWLNGRAGRVPLSGLIERIAREAGLYAVDASGCTAMVTGYVIDRPMAGRAALEPLFDLYQLDATETGGVLTVRPRTGEATEALSEDGLVDMTADEAPLTIERVSAAAAPGALTLAYMDGLSDYRRGVATARLPGSVSASLSVAATTVVLEQGEADGRAETLLAEAQAAGTTARFALPPGAVTLEPSDVVALAGETLRLTEITDGPWREVQAVRTAPALYAPRYTGLAGTAAPLTLTPGPVLAEVLDIPLLPNGQDGLFVHLAAFADPWPGGVSVAEAGGPDARLLARADAPALMGRLTEPLAPGAPWRWDRAGRVRLRLPAGALSSLTERAVLSGGGRLAVASGGAWEILSYRDAALGEDGVWTLTTLLRGLRGTEPEAAAGAEAGARIVVLDGARAVPMTADALGAEAVWQAGPAGRAPGAFPFRPLPVAFAGASARPFAPVHLRVEAADGARRLVWTRRSRVGGDGWGGTVPLGEADERYRVTWTLADGTEAAEDTNGPAAAVPPGAASVRVAQLSRTVGAGRAARLVL